MTTAVKYSVDSKGGKLIIFLLLKEAVAFNNVSFGAFAQIQLCEKRKKKKKS